MVHLSETSRNLTVARLALPSSFFSVAVAALLASSEPDVSVSLLSWLSSGVASTVLVTGAKGAVCASTKGKEPPRSRFWRTCSCLAGAKQAQNIICPLSPSWAAMGNRWQSAPAFAAPRKRKDFSLPRTECRIILTSGSRAQLAPCPSVEGSRSTAKIWKNGWFQ